jgi:hypothetical protein
MTSVAALRHPWLQAPLAAAPDMAKLRLVTPILISDRAEDDVDESTLAQLAKFGLGRDEILRQVLSKTHSALATLYYLLLNVISSKRRGYTKGRSSSSSSSSSSGQTSGASARGHPRRPQSSGAVRPSHDPSANHTHRFATATTGNLYAQQGANATQAAEAQPTKVAEGLGANMTRPRSASATRSSGHSSRPLSAYAGRTHHVAAQ